MASFFDKLKKGMGVEDQESERPVKRASVKLAKKKATVVQTSVKVPKVEKIVIRKAVVMNEEPEPEEELTPPEEVEEEQPKPEEEKPAPAPEIKEDWTSIASEPEGQLAVDIYQTPKHLIIQSAIAGIKPEELDISIERDIISVKGIRQKPFEEKGDYLSQECYWGAFAREVALPVEIDPDRSEAIMKEGILTIRLPKISREKKRNIKVKES